MSTTAQVRSAWNTNVMQHATVQAMTTSIIDDDYTTDTRKELSRLRYGQQYHFISYIVTRQETPGIIGARRYEYTVDLSYYLEADTTGDNHSTAVDNLETIDGLVYSELGATWGSTVDFYTPPSGTPSIDLIDISGKLVWKATATYSAEKIVSI